MNTTSKKDLKVIVFTAWMGFVLVMNAIFSVAQIFFMIVADNVNVDSYNLIKLTLCILKVYLAYLGILMNRKSIYGFYGLAGLSLVYYQLVEKFEVQFMSLIGVLVLFVLVNIGGKNKVMNQMKNK